MRAGAHRGIRCKIELHGLEYIVLARLDVYVLTTREQGRAPGQTAVEGLVEPEPGVSGFVNASKIGQVHQAVVVGASDEMHRVNRNEGNRWLVLALKSRVFGRDIAVW